LWIKTESPREQSAPKEQSNATRDMSAQNNTAATEAPVEERKSVMQKQLDKQKEIDAEVEREFTERKTALEARGESLDKYRDGQLMAQEQMAKKKGVMRNQAKTIGKAQELGLISSRTASDALTADGANPFAVSQMGTRILMRFRQKSMLIIILQSAAVNGVAFAVDRELIFYLPPYHWMLYMSTWIVPLMILFVLNMFRYKTPLNYALLFLFSFVIGITFGLLQVPMESYTLMFTNDRSRNWSPQCYGMAGHTIALVLLTLLTALPHGNKGMVKMAPVSLVVAFLTNIGGIAAYQTYWNYVGPPLFVMVAVFMNTLSLAWIGYQMDVCAARLQVDEFLYPCILLWCEVFIAMFLAIVFIIGILMLFAGEGGGDGVGDASGFSCEGVGYGCYGFYCDCYYGGSISKKDDEETGENVPG